MKKNILCVLMAIMLMVCIQPCGFANEENKGEGTYFYLSAESILYEKNDRQNNILYPVKVYENGFYDRTGFHLFNNETKSVCDVLGEILNYYYENDEETADGIRLEDEEGNTPPYSTDKGWITMSVYDRYNKEYINYNGNCRFSFDGNGDKSSDNVKWIVGDDPYNEYVQITDGSIARWILSDSIDVFFGYESPACDDLICAIGDYYEKRSNEGVSKTAENAYTEAIENFFSEETQDYADKLRAALEAAGASVPAIAAVYDLHGKFKGMKSYENAPEIAAAADDLNALQGDTVKIFFWNSLVSQEPAEGKTMLSEIIK